MSDAIDGSIGTIHTLQDLLTRLPKATEQEISLVHRAYELANAAHAGVIRKSGEPYITHPLTVAAILADVHLDAETIAAALLHDVVEDTRVTLEDLKTQFGDTVAELVDGVTKLSQREDASGEFNAGLAMAAVASDSETFAYRTEREAESLRKMMLSVVKDIRVVLIKLADRLHNMRTLSAMKPEKQRKIARETLDIYAPLANRLGVWEWKQELEDLGMRYTDPDSYAYLTRLLQAEASVREERIRSYIGTVREALADHGIHRVHISGRAKAIYSLWRKMNRKNIAFDQIRDTHAIRVIIEDDPNQSSATDEPEIDTQLEPEAAAAAARERRRHRKRKQMADPAVQACYTALGLVHQLWPPITSEFDDYIAVPKDNHYQSLHTAVLTDLGTLEIQIRTRSMHLSAEFGVAAHWLYKDSAALDQDATQQIEVLRNAIRSIGSNAENATEFVENLRTDQLNGQVFAFSPKGKVIELPQGATALDFAYRIHSDIGDRCRGAKVNGIFQSVGHKLKNGDIVEIVTRKDPMPSRDWLHEQDFCVTPNAKHKIKAYFRRQDRMQNISAGREIIETELRKLSVSAWMKPNDVMRLFKVSAGEEEDFLERIGFGQITSVALTSRIMEEVHRRDKEREERFDFSGLLDRLRPKTNGLETDRATAKKGSFLVADVQGLEVQMAQCCKPVPGDPLIGYITRGQGIRAHHRDCKNIANAEQERLVPIEFVGSASSDVFVVQFLVTAAERVGLLGELTTALADQKINITGCNIAKRNLKQGEVQVWIKVEVRSANDIAGAMSRMKSVKNVFDVNRVTNQPRG
jgi:GTP diphosphokinase / guanosine-3',5'-bis(diphosphate) 3'-diphosphatase